MASSGYRSPAVAGVELGAPEIRVWSVYASSAAVVRTCRAHPSAEESGPQGKPSLVDARDLRFNVTGSGFAAWDRRRARSYRA